MRRVTVDKQVLARRAGRSAITYEQAAVVQAEMAEQLVLALRDVAGTERFERVLELGCGTGLLSRRLVERCRVSRLALNDLAPGFERTADSIRGMRPDLYVEFLAGDMEKIQLPGEQDMIVSNAAFQWLENPEALLARLGDGLRKGGVLALATFGRGNLREVADISGLALRYRALEEWKALLAGRFEILAAKETERVMWFESARDVLRHLRETGVNALDADAWSRARIREFCRGYESAFGHAGRVSLTYHPLLLVARKSRGKGGA